MVVMLLAFRFVPTSIILRESKVIFGTRVAKTKGKNNMLEKNKKEQAYNL
jgi:hypothetical protein